MNRRDKELKRRWLILETLYENSENGKGITTKELCDLYKVTNKTIYRDISALKIVGSPIVRSKNRWIVEDRAGLKYISYHFNKYQKTLSQISKIIKKRQLLICIYCGVTGKKKQKFVVEPYELNLFNNEYFLISQDHFTKKFKVFVIARLEIIETLSKNFRKPSASVLSEFKNSQFEQDAKDELFHIQIQFSSLFKDILMKTIIHPTQRLTVQDNNIILAISVGCLEMIVPWILSFGVNATVVYPQQLIILIKEEIKLIKEAYDKLSNHQLTIY